MCFKHKQYSTVCRHEVQTISFSVFNVLGFEQKFSTRRNSDELSRSASCEKFYHSSLENYRRVQGERNNFEIRIPSMYRGWLWTAADPGGIQRTAYWLAIPESNTKMTCSQWFDRVKRKQVLVFHLVLKWKIMFCNGRRITTCVDCVVI